MKKAIFFDKDGTLIPNIPYNINSEKIELFANACAGISALYKANFLLFVISNQSGVAKGFFKESALAGVRTKIETLLFTLRVKLSGFYFCPHHPDGCVLKYAKPCNCRKPAPGMLLQASKEHDIDLCSSWMIGDILHDIEAGNRAGCRSILIDNGGETIWQQGEFRKPYFIAKSIDEAARLILNNSQ